MKPLQDVHVVVTRPAHQAGHFQQLLETAGARAHRYPLLAIQAVEQIPATLQKAQYPGDYDLLIFISANAVEHGLALLPDISPARIGAIGQQTAQALQAHQLRVSLVPEAGFTSEDFLALPALQQLTGQRVLIIRGDGGRELLADALSARGAEVDYANVYQRICPKNPPDQLKQLHESQQLDIITVTSSEGLRNLLFLMNDADWIKHIPLLVGSERMARDAQSAGFHTLLVAANPSDDAMLEALIRWHTGYNNDDRQASI